MNYIRQISFTSTTDLLQNSDIKGAITDTLGLDAAGYSARITANAVTSEKMGFRMAFEITLAADGTLTLNGEDIDLKASKPYSTVYPVDVYQLTLKSSGSGTISMDIRR